MRNKVGIIGGGASGMMAAITAARLGAVVTLLEGNDRVGKKLLATGNGKCNLGNYALSKEAYYGSSREWIAGRLADFDTEDTIAFFEELGLLIKEKNGYLYPACEQASAVLDVLRFELKALGIELIAGYKVKTITYSARTKKITVSDGISKMQFDSVVLACGSKAAPVTGSDGSGYKLAKSLGHTIVPVVPALVQLKCSDTYCKAVGGVRTDAFVRVMHKGKCVAAERGELQLTEYGVSGIPVFQISRVVNYLLQSEKEVSLEVDLLPDFDDYAYKRLWLQREMLKKNRTAEEYFTGIIPKKIMQLFLKQAGLRAEQPMERADEKAVQQVYALCRRWEFHVTGSNTYEKAQVCAGGVPAQELTEEMESRLVPGVYFAGEIIDVDGKCGGYNLQWAWCSGYLAGKGAALKNA